MNISIRVPNYNVFISNNILCINDKRSYVKDDIITELVSYTINWEDAYFNDAIPTGETYFFEIGNKKYTFSNKYPSNFDNFLNFLGDLYDKIGI